MGYVSLGSVKVLALLKDGSCPNPDILLLLDEVWLIKRWTLQGILALCNPSLSRLGYADIVSFRDGQADGCELASGPPRVALLLAVATARLSGSGARCRALGEPSAHC